MIKKILPIFALICSLVIGIQSTAEASSDESILAYSVNAQRVARGLPELSINAELTSLAAVWSGVMAKEGNIFHSDLQTGVTQNWLKLGENVGAGGSAEAIAGAFIASPPHLQNIIDPAFQFLGIGITNTGTKLYVVQRFMQLNEEIASKPVPQTTIPVFVQPKAVIPPVTTIPIPEPPPTSVPSTTTTTIPEAKVVSEKNTGSLKKLILRLTSYFWSLVRLKK